jgi:hypothetical protein
MKHIVLVEIPCGASQQKAKRPQWSGCGIWLEVFKRKKIESSDLHFHTNTMLLGLHCSPHVCATAGCCVLGRYNGLVVPSMPVFVTTTHKIDAMAEEKKCKRQRDTNQIISQ